METGLRVCWRSGDDVVEADRSGWTAELHKVKVPNRLRHRAPLLALGANVIGACCRHESEGSLRLGQLVTRAPARCGIRASTRARTPCGTVRRLTRITPLRSRNVNVRVARPAPNSNVRVVWNADVRVWAWRVLAALAEGVIRRTSEAAIERAWTRPGREVTKEIRVWSLWESSIRARSGWPVMGAAGLSGSCGA